MHRLLQVGLPFYDHLFSLTQIYKDAVLLGTLPQVTAKLLSQNIFPSFAAFLATAPCSPYYASLDSLVFIQQVPIYTV